MKMSISNIGWEEHDDMCIYSMLKEKGFSGIEIAPTRILEENPYEKLKEAEQYREKLAEKGLEICSMQSIWYGKTENLFNSKMELEILKEYSLKAILFAKALRCKNLVFGCPKNRYMGKKVTFREGYNIAKEFFKVLGDFAYENGTCFSLEPNPIIYNTDFINTTAEAVDIVKEINCPGLKVNLDFGTIIANNENLSDIDVSYVNHIHISEPGLQLIQVREAHEQLLRLMNKSGYKGFVSIEMIKSTISDIEKVLDYLKRIVIKTEEDM